MPWGSGTLFLSCSACVDWVAFMSGETDAVLSEEGKELNGVKEIKEASDFDTLFSAFNTLK